MTANLESPSMELGTAEATPAPITVHNDTTKFADDTIGLEASPIGVTHTDEFVTQLIAKSSQTIIDYLERPSVLTYGSFTTTDSGILWITDVVNTVTPPKARRLDNIYTIKNDYKITLQVNADRFQQGRYILFWLPSGGGTTPPISGANLAWRNMHTCTLTKITQLPHVEIDLATQTHVTLNIPYTSIHPMNSWSTSTGTMTYGMGPIGLIPYSKLNPGLGGSTTCGYTVWGSLQNITIGSASYNQMNVSVKEGKAYGQGPISGVLDKISRTASMLGDVPVVGSYARTTSWASALAAKAARIWGWSKPLALASPNRVDRKINTFAAVADVTAFHKPLGVMSENSVAVPPNISTNIDEMSIDFIKKIPAYITGFNWSTSATAGTILFQTTVAPNSYTSWSAGFTFTPASFIAAQFSRWRGSMVYTFKLVKTSFHRGRLLVAFFPGTVSALTTSIDQTEFVYREIVDVSETNTFSVCCPYMVPQPWLSSGGMGFQISGTLIVYVVDPLVAPSTVSASIDALVETAAGDDFQVAIPAPWAYEPYSPSTAQMAEQYIETPCFDLGPKSTSVDDRLPVFTMGESVKSVRQLLKRQWIFNAIVGVGGGSWAEFWPYVVEPVMQAAGSGGVLKRSYFFTDPVNLWACAYAMAHGSMRYSLTSSVLSAQTVTTAYVKSNTRSSIESRSSRPSGGSVSVYNNSSIEGLIEFQTPNWNTGIGRATPAQLVNASFPLTATDPMANLTTVAVLGELSTEAIAVHSAGVARSAGDDFGFGIFVGVPPVVANTSV
jgi:hypothetical protein